MKYLVVFCLCLSAVFAFPKLSADPAEICSADKCAAPDCRCSDAGVPLDLEKTPQLIAITSDEAVVENLFQDYWVPILSRQNPDGAQIGATFFVPHEYTDYTRVNALYNSGLEIGVHSITKNSLQNYWRTADEETLVKEFGGQRDIISKFANIPKDDVVGVRSPQLQLNGNISISAYVESGLQYDNSQPTLNAKPLFPYTLDYKSTQQCVVAAACPNESFKGFWVIPILNLVGNEKECNSLGDCEETGSADDIKNWLNDQLANIKKTKTPLTIRISTLWFEQVKGAHEGLLAFLDDLANQSDVFLVNQKQIIEWVKNPVELDKFTTDTEAKEAECSKVTCKLQKSDTETRYMNSCVDCPNVYPWLGNPEGK